MSASGPSGPLVVFFCFFFLGGGGGVLKNTFNIVSMILRQFLNFLVPNQSQGAQWLSGRVLGMRRRGRGFEP